MITLPKIRLWDEFWHYRLQPDKEAFAEVIRDWPPALLARLRHVIKLRFGDERFTAPSIMEAMQNLGFWPLDAVTRGVLMELGNADLSSEADLRGRLDKLRRYSFFVLASGAAHDFECIRTLPAADAAGLIRGLNIAEECGYSQSGGSVSMVNWSFAVFRQQHPLPVWADLADCIITHSTNPYIPFNFQRTRHQWEACREGSPSPAETWRRVGEAERRRQKEKAERAERESREVKERATQRAIKAQKNREEHEDRSRIRALERLGACVELQKLPPLQRLERICADTSYPLEFYLKEFAELADEVIAAMPEPLRLSLIDRLKDRRKGVWHRLLLRLQNRPRL